MLGTAPDGSPVTSTVTDLDLGGPAREREQGDLPRLPAFLSSPHLLQNVDVTIDRIGPGSSEIEYTIRGTRDGGASWELTRSTRYASEFDISFDSVLEVAFTAEVLQAFEGEEIEVTSIDVPRLDVKEAFERYDLRRLLVWNGSRYAEEDFVGRTARPEDPAQSRSEA